jgi:hypothetical protein
LAELLFNLFSNKLLMLFAEWHIFFDGKREIDYRLHRHTSSDTLYEALPDATFQMAQPPACQRAVLSTGNLTPRRVLSIADSSQTVSPPIPLWEAARTAPPQSKCDR